MAEETGMLAAIDFSQYMGREIMILVKGCPWTLAIFCACEEEKWKSGGGVFGEDVGSLLNLSGLKAFTLHYLF